MIALGRLLSPLVGGSRPWESRDAALIVLSAMAQDSRLQLDWDDAAGERWIRLLSSGSAVAMASTVLPLVFTLAPFSLRFQDRADHLLVIEVESLDARVLRCDAETLELAFVGATASQALDPAAFSVQELWFASV